MGKRFGFNASGGTPDAHGGFRVQFYSMTRGTLADPNAEKRTSHLSTLLLSRVIATEQLT
jgi:hypothetical protein